jgi:hypothetical protein
MQKKNQTIIAGETVLVPVGELKGYDKNPRKGNVQAIAQSLEINKQYRPIVVQKSTKKILAGNHTWKAAKSLGWEEIAVVFVDVNDEEAKRIVLADNRTNDLADYDGQILAELLRDLGTSEGTGYSASDMDALLKNLDEDFDNVAEITNQAGERTLAENDALISVGTGMGGSSSSSDNEFSFTGEDEEEADIEDEPDDLSGVYTLKDDLIFPGASFWEIPVLRDDMMIEDLPQPLHTWAGSATRDLDWDGYWLYNWGIDSTSGMKDLSKIVLSFYCWDEYIEPWWDNPSRHMSKVLHAKIKYAITPNLTPNDMPRASSLWQLYRSRWVGRYLQEIGVRVMPDLQVREEQEFIDISCKALPKNLKWASIQTQNLVGSSRTGQGITQEEADVHKDWTRKSVRAADPENLLVYAHPKTHDEMQSYFGHGTERNVFCIPTRLFYLSQKVRNNSKEKDRI